MKLSDVKHQIDAYFNAVNPLDIVKQFEALGYEFEELLDDSSSGYEFITTPTTSITGYSTPKYCSPLELEIEDVIYPMSLKVSSISSEEQYNVVDSQSRYALAA